MTKPDFPALVTVSAFFPKHGGGIERVAGQLGVHLARMGFPLHWFAGGTADEVPDDSTSIRNFTHAETIDFLEKRVGLPAPLWSISSLRKLHRAIRAAQAIHLHDCLYMSSIAAFVMAKFHRKKVLVTQHIGTIPFRSRLLHFMHGLANRTVARIMLTHADAVIFVSPTVRQYFSEFVRFRNPPDVVFNGVDHEVFYPSPTVSFRPSQDMKMLFVGRFVEKKGIHLLRSCVGIPGTQWTFVGKGPLSPSTWNTAMDNATILSDLTPQQLADLYRESDLMVLPSIGEGFPLVVQEALACGLPVLVSSEVASIFGPGRTDAVLVHDETQSDREDALRSQLTLLASNPADTRLLRTAARDLAKAWSWQSCADHYATVIRRIC